MATDYAQRVNLLRIYDKGGDMKKLHSRIFIPVFLVLLIFPLLTFTAFSMVSDGYFENMAKRNTVQMVRQVRRIISETPDKLIRGLQSLEAEHSPKTSVLIFGRDMELRYPHELPMIEGLEELASEAGSMISENNIPGKDMMRLDLKNGSYMIQFLYNEGRSGPSRYVVCYSAIPNTGTLMDSVWRLLLLITFFCLLFSGIVIWFIARGISRPIEKLCKKAEAIGRGEYTSLPERFNIQELEELKDSMDHMAAELKKSEQSTVSFFQNASHDLKTPLASISGYAQAIQCGVAEDDKAAAEIILNESKRMTALVESILTISKLDNKSFELDMVNIGLGDFLEDQAQILQVTTDKKITLQKDIPKLSAEADPNLLTRILQNLVSNAIRYAEHEVSLGLERKDNMAMITVSDDGPGIDTEELPHIFERFYKGEKGGFGLGLSIVKTGISYMGGEIRAENRQAPEHGAVFSLLLPVKQDEVPYDHK